MSDKLYPPFDLDIPKMGHFILYKGKGKFLHRQIEKQQLKEGFLPEHTEYVHIEVLGGGQYSVDPSLPKVKVIDLTKKHKNKEACIVKYIAPDYHTQRYKVAFWAASNVNLKYDLWGVIRLKFWFIPSGKMKFFCSENSLFALQKEYPLALSKQPYDCYPADFLSDSFEVVWKGIIQ